MCRQGNREDLYRFKVLKFLVWFVKFVKSGTHVFPTCKTVTWSGLWSEVIWIVIGCGGGGLVRAKIHRLAFTSLLPFHLVVAYIAFVHGLHCVALGDGPVGGGICVLDFPR